MIKNLPKTLLLAHLGLLAANLIWGAAGPVIKYTLNFLPPFTFLFFRFLIVGTILLPFLVLELSKTKIDKRDYLNLFLLGVFSQTSIAIVFLSLKYTTAIDAAIISVIGTILTVYSGHYFYKDRIDTKIKLGLIAASVGTLVVVFEPILTNTLDHVPPSQRLLGNFLALFYNLTWLIYLIWSKMSMGERSSMLKRTLSFIHIKPMQRRYSPFMIVALSFYVGLVTIFPFFILENLSFFGYSGFNPTKFGYEGILGLLFMSIFSSIIAYTLNQWSLENARVSDVALYSYLSVLFSLPFAYILLGETVSVVVMVGGILIASGIVIAEWKNT